jgi:hypothetical protein
VTDRERAIQALRRGVPLGEVVKCSCFTTPPTRNGCFGVCEDAVAAIVASYEAMREEQKEEIAAEERRKLEVEAMAEHFYRHPHG